MTEVNAAEFSEQTREVFQELKDEGFTLEGKITATRTDEETGQTDVLVMDPSVTNTPSFDDQVNEETDQPTASEAPPTPGAPEPEQAGDAGASADYDEGSFTSPSAASKAEEAGLDPEDIEGTGRDNKITVADVEEAIADQE